MAYKLVVSSLLAFTATLSFATEEGGTRTFTMRLKADKPVFSEFLAARKLQLLEWLGDSPLVDDAGLAVPAGPDALAALMECTGVSHAFFSAYVEATGAKAKLGN